MEWKRLDRDLYSIRETFDGCTYQVTVYVEHCSKNIKFWFGASSGRKRKLIEVFEEKPQKSSGGMKALLWIKSQVMEFPQWYNSKEDNQYICIQWADARRKKIYSRLQNDGFRFMTIRGEQALVKKLWNIEKNN